MIVELMVAPRQTMYASLRDRALVEIGMRRWNNRIIKPMKEVDLRTLRKSCAKIRGKLHVIDRPAPLSKKWRCNEKDGAEPGNRGMSSEHPGKNGPADGMPDNNRTVPKCSKLLLKHRFPQLIAGIAFVRHTRIPHVEPVSQLTLQTGNQLTIPSIVNTFATPLDEQHLAFFPHPHFSARSISGVRHDTYPTCS